VREGKIPMWPTPRATDGSKGGRTEEGARKELARGKNIDLGVAVKMWPTPTAGDSRGTRNSTAIRKDPQSKHHEGTTLTDAAVPTGGQLNPIFVEWLMGFPLGWTDLEDSVTQ
jgi:hypothetical protein